jgi:hypothetical protein
MTDGTGNGRGVKPAAPPRTARVATTTDVAVEFVVRRVRRRYRAPEAAPAPGPEGPAPAATSPGRAYVAASTRRHVAEEFAHARDVRRRRGEKRRRTA